MQLPRLNTKLALEYGYFEGTLDPNWRVVFADDELEKRWVTHTPEGLPLTERIVKEVPKYRQWAKGKYILEKLLPVPEGRETDLIAKISYEPVWVFEDSNGKPLDNNLVRSEKFYDAVKFVIEQVNEQSAKAVGAKYKDPEAFSTNEERREKEKVRLDKISKMLFGNETPVGDALMQQSGVSYAGVEMPKKN